MEIPGEQGGSSRGVGRWADGGGAEGVEQARRRGSGASCHFR